MKKTIRSFLKAAKNLVQNLQKFPTFQIKSFILAVFKPFTVGQGQRGIRVGVTKIDAILTTFLADLGTYENYGFFATAIQAMSLSGFYGNTVRIAL